MKKQYKILEIYPFLNPSNLEIELGMKTISTIIKLRDSDIFTSIKMAENFIKENQHLFKGKKITIIPIYEFI